MLQRLLVALLACILLCQVVVAWDKEDYEIFDLVASLEKSEGKGTSFYNFLNVTPSVETAEVSRQFRKRSRELHPDKNPERPDAQERYALLSVVAEILRDDERRKRYHHFYVNGVPTWRGTGYYYERFRPGLGSVLVLLGVFTCLAQLVAQYVTYRLEIKRVQNFREAAQRIAYGQSLSDARKKIKVPLWAGSTGASEDMGKRAVAGQRSVDMVVQGANVALVSDGEEHVLDPATVQAPSLLRTWIPSLLQYILSFVVPSTKASSGSEAGAEVAPAEKKRGGKKKQT